MYINAEHKRIELDEQVKRLSAEVIELTKQRDIIYQEVTDQRKAKSIVASEQMSLESITYLLDKQSELLLTARDKNFNLFTKEYTTHNEILTEIESSIEKSKSLLTEYKVSKEDVIKLEKQ